MPFGARACRGLRKRFAGLREMGDFRGRSYTRVCAAPRKLFSLRKTADRFPNERHGAYGIARANSSGMRGIPAAGRAAQPYLEAIR